MINIKVNIGFILILTLIAVSCNDTDKQVEKIELKTKMDTISYIIGLDYGIGIREQKIEPNQMAIYKGLKDGLAGESILSDSLKEKLIDDFNEELKITTGGGAEIEDFSDFKNNYAYIFSPEIGYYPIDNTEIKIGIMLIDGTDNTTFGRVKESDEVYLKVNYSF